MELTLEQIQAYEQDGAVCLRQVFDRYWISHLQACTEIALADPSAHAEEYTDQGEPGRAFNDLDLARRHEGFRTFIEESCAGEIAAKMMTSSKVNFFYDQLIVKEPNTKERTPWHQDQPYWAVVGRQVCSLWLPLDPVHKDMCVQYVSGSHFWPAHNPHHFAQDQPYRGTGLPELPDIDGNRSAYKFHTWDMEPGDCIVFHGMTVHGAPGNSSADRRRRALATRWTGDDVTYQSKPGETGAPTRDPGLSNGDIMDCADFPVIWRA